MPDKKNVQTRNSENAHSAISARAEPAVSRPLAASSAAITRMPMSRSLMRGEGKQLDRVLAGETGLMHKGGVEALQFADDKKFGQA